MLRELVGSLDLTVAFLEQQWDGHERVAPAV
jgi:hypothetical protein